MKIIKEFKEFLRIRKRARDISKQLSLDEAERFAKELTNNPLYKNIVEEIKKEAILFWEKTIKVEERERLWMWLTAINEIDLRIKGTLEIVKFEKSKLK